MTATCDFPRTELLTPWNAYFPRKYITTVRLRDMGFPHRYCCRFICSVVLFTNRHGTRALETWNFKHSIIGNKRRKCYGLQEYTVFTIQIKFNKRLRQRIRLASKNSLTISLHIALPVVAVLNSGKRSRVNFTICHETAVRVHKPTRCNISYEWSLFSINL